MCTAFNNFKSRSESTFCRSSQIWAQLVCKDYQQTTKVAASKERIKKVKLWKSNYFPQIDTLENIEVPDKML